MRPQRKDDLITTAVFATVAILALLMWVGIVYVVIHFLTKWW